MGIKVVSSDSGGRHKGLRDIAGFLMQHISIAILIVVVFLVCASLALVDVVMEDTVASYSIDDYEIGQIADRTIYADKSLSASVDSNISVHKGEKIIRKGFPITEDEYRKLERMATTPGYIDYRAFGNDILFLMLIVALWILLWGRSSLGGRKVEFKEMLLEGVFLILVYGMSIAAGKTPLFSQPWTMVIVIPSCISVFIVAILFGQISANYYSLVLSFAVLLGAHFSIVPFVWTLATCLTAGRIVCHIVHRLDLIFAAISLSMLNMVFMLVLHIVFLDLGRGVVFSLVGAAANGFLSGILVLGLLPPLEQLLNTASVFRLRDLDDVNSPLLRKLQLQASGTYNHSLMVATLAQSACTAIGANGLMARVAAYYHDVGKMDQSEYFTENLAAGVRSAHADINPSLSISVIRSHVKKSVEKVREMHFPKEVIDIIAQHHGNSVIEAFYRALAVEDDTVTPDSCRYSGVPPTTRESAVVMLADVSEAACHSLDNPTGPRIEKFIDTLVNAKIKNKQLDNCDLTFRDVAKIKAVFVQILTGFYHTRIKYPDQKDPDTGPGNKASETVTSAVVGAKSASMGNMGNTDSKGAKEGSSDGK